jgi:hypothetical protein
MIPDVETDQVEHHPATVHVMSMFTYDHLPDHLRDLSRECADLASLMYNQLPPGPELTVGLRKLLEAKDCFVRAAVAAHKAA